MPVALPQDPTCARVRLDDRPTPVPADHLDPHAVEPLLTTGELRAWRPCAANRRVARLPSDQGRGVAPERLQHLLFRKHGDANPGEPEVGGGLGLAICKGLVPTLALLDLVLPGTDGIELMETVPELADVPVIFISGHRRDEAIARALEAGADDCIVKPFSPTEYELLRVLSVNAGRVVTCDALLRTVWSGRSPDANSGRAHRAPAR